MIQNRGKGLIPESQENEVAPYEIDQTHIYSRLQALLESSNGNQTTQKREEYISPGKVGDKLLESSCQMWLP